MNFFTAGNATSYEIFAKQQRKKNRMKINCSKIIFITTFDVFDKYSRQLEHKVDNEQAEKYSPRVYRGHTRGRQKVCTKKERAYKKHKNIPPSKN